MLFPSRKKDIKKTPERASSSEQIGSEVKSWVFLSHSNLDYDRVTFVRNALEKQHKRPIMFFLKCIDNKRQLSRFIKKEIDARDQFILCDSQNARNSEWVQEEVAYIKSKGRVFQTINLEDSDEEIERNVTDFVNRTKVFLSYSRADYNLASAISQKLREYGYDCWLDTNRIAPGMSIYDSIKDALDSTIREGFQILLLSESSMNSQWVNKEFEYFHNHGGEKWTIPVRIDSAPLTESIVFKLGGIPICDVSMVSSDIEKANHVLQHLIQKNVALSI